MCVELTPEMQTHITYVLHRVLHISIRVLDISIRVLHISIRVLHLGYQDIHPPLIVAVLVPLRATHCAKKKKRKGGIGHIDNPSPTFR
jgi:hypothetical protein